MDSGFSSLRLLLGLAGAAFIIFRRFAFLYAGIAAVLFAGVIPLNFDVSQADTIRRLFGIVILFLIFGVARERRKDHDWEFPGDLYAALEATAWAAMYVLDQPQGFGMAVHDRRRPSVLLGHLRGDLDAACRRTVSRDS